MPRIYSVDSRFASSPTVREVPVTTTMIVGGIAYDKLTLQPKSPSMGDENNPVIRDWVANGVESQATTPSLMYLTRQNFNTGIAGCYYYASGYGRVKNMFVDTVNNRTFYVQHPSPGVNTSLVPSNSPWGYVTTHGLNSSGAQGGWGYIRDFNHLGSFNPGSTFYLQTGVTSVLAYSNANEGFLWNNRYNFNVTAGTLLSNATATLNLQNTGVAPIVGIFRIDSAGTRYYWRTLYNCTNVDAGESFWGPAYHGTLQGTPGGTIINPTYSVLQTENSTTTTSVQTATVFGPSTWNYKQFILSTDTHIYFLEFSLGQSAIGTSTVSNVMFLKRMVYAGAETTLGSYSAWLYGLKLPTQIFNETATAASFIFHTWAQWTGSAGPVTLIRVDVNKTNGSETLTTIGQDSASATAFTRLYNLLGIQTTTVPLGVYNNFYWREHLITRSWIVTGNTGTNYLMMSVEHDALNFAGNVTRSAPILNSPYTLPGGVNPNTVYSTSSLNDNGSGFLRRDCFKILSWTLDSNFGNVTYGAETDMSAFQPRWYFPVDSGQGMTQYMSHASDSIVDRVIQFNETTKQWAITNSMPYRADTIGVDELNRTWISSNPAGTGNVETLFLEGVYIPQTVNVSTFQTSYNWAGSNIASNISVAVNSFTGGLIAANVGIVLAGDVAFSDGSKYQVITTDTLSPAIANIVITGVSGTRFTANIINLI